ncbi:MAG: OmpA family protein [Flavobacteriales bacterium]
MTYMRGALSTLCLIFITTVAISQKDWTEEADMTYQAGAYYGAIDVYKKAYSKEKKNSEKARILFRIGDCYRNIQDEAQAEVWYIKAEAAEYDNPELHVRMGDVLMKQGKYDEAVERYKKGLATSSGDIKREAENGVASCEKAIKLSKQPARYVVRNEAPLNTAYFDFSPYFADKKYQSIMFSSTRPGASGGSDDGITGEGFSDIFISERDNKGKWSAPVPIGETINSPANEGAPYMTDKFDQLYFTRCGYEKKKPFGCEIYTVRLQGRDWGEPELLDFGIDDTTAAGHAVALDEDIIIFSSDMYGGQGGKDLWMIKYDGGSKIWGPARNLGSSINTPGDEMFPYVHENGDLFFASDGHIGMGGLDIFKAPMKGESPKEGSWGKPENMGAPLNSSANDFAIIFEPGAGTDRGYFTSDRQVAGAKGKDDIYSFFMPGLIFALEGKVTDIETKEPLGNVLVRLLGTDGSVSEIKTDPTGAYSFEKKENDERYIAENTSYTIEVNGMEEKTTTDHRYLGAKGQETTVGLKESTKFVKDFQLQCADCEYEIPMPQVFYPLAKWDLVVDDKVNSKDSLDFLYQTLIDNPTIIIELAAHTDTRGNDKSNEILSQKRAQTCVDYLAGKGIDPARMVPVGYGESRPKITDEQIAAMGTEQEREAAHAKNRRTVFSVLSFDYVPKEQPEGSK